MNFSLFFIFISFVFGAYINKCSAQILQFGSCVDFDTVSLFDIERFFGEWYEIERYPIWYERNGQCSSLRFNNCVNKIDIDHVYVMDDIRYIIHMNSTYSPGADAVFYINESSVDPLGMPLSVVFTDYDNYAIVVGCKSNDELAIRYLSAWILSRDTSLDLNLLNQAHEELNSLPMIIDFYLKPVSHDAELCSHMWTAHVYGD